MSTPENRTGPRIPETTSENPDVNVERETGERVDRTEEGIRNADPSQMRENVQPTWKPGERNGVQYGDASIDGKKYRVYEDGRVYRQEGRKLKRVAVGDVNSLPPAVQAQMGIRVGETSRGTRYREITVDGLRYRALETGDFWRQNGTRYEKVPAEGVNDLPPIVREMSETVRASWQNVTENGTRYKQLEMSDGSGTYRISEHGRVLLQARGGGDFEFLAPGERLPPIVQAKLDVILAYVNRQEQQRSTTAAPEVRERADDLTRAAEVLTALKGIRIENGRQRLSIGGLPGTKEQMFSRLSKLSIRPDRYGEFVDNLRQASGHMEEVFKRYVPPHDSWEGTVVWNESLNRLESECTAEGNTWKGERIVATAVGVLRQPSGSPRHGSGYGASRKENFMTFPTRENPNGYRVVRKTAVDRNLTNYWMYDHQHPSGNHYDYIAPDGGLRLRKTGSESRPSTLQTFDHESNTRPATVSVRRSGEEISYTSTNDPNSERVQHRFDRTGNYALDNEGGKPVGDFEDFKSRVQSGALEVPAGTDEREAYVDFITENLRTPEAIANFLSSHISFNGSGIDSPVEYRSESGQDVQHPLVTLERGRGDCEDFALLFDYMLEKIGVPALAMRKSICHLVCVYFEERYVEEGGTMQKRYDAVVMDTSGFRRTTSKNPRGYESQEAALKGLVSADMTYRVLPSLESKYRSLESRDPASLTEGERRNLGRLQRARQVAQRTPEGGGGGIELLYPPSTVLPQGSRERVPGRSGFISYGANFDRYTISSPDSSRRRNS